MPEWTLTQRGCEVVCIRVVIIKLKLDSIACERHFERKNTVRGFLTGFFFLLSIHIEVPHFMALAGSDDIFGDDLAYVKRVAA